MNKILAIDDEHRILETLSAIFDQNGFDGNCVESGEAALSFLDDKKKDLPDIILLDIRMPNMNGFKVAEILRKRDDTKFIPIIFLAAYTDTESIVKAFEVGGVDYVSKPFNMYELLARINTHLGVKKLVDDLRVANKVLEEKTEERDRMTHAMVSALEDVNFYNDTDTGNHIKRVSEISALIAKSYGCDDEFIKNITTYASLHDIGKVGISDDLLKKPGKYTEQEFEDMKKHVQIGHKMLSAPEVDDMARNIVLYHHERWDGSGYLKGLRGEDIPLEARIVALADVYDALVTQRVYKDAMKEEDADAIIKKDSGTHFDPKVVDAFFNIKENIREICRRLK